MGIGTLVETRGRKDLEQFIERKVTEPAFREFIIVMYNPDYENYKTKVSQLNPDEIAAGRQEVVSNVALFRKLQSKFPKFKLRFYKESFQPTSLYVYIDNSVIRMSPYFLKIVGRHSPFLFEFYKGGDIFQFLADQVEVIISDEFSEPAN